MSTLDDLSFKPYFSFGQVQIRDKTRGGKEPSEKQDKSGKKPSQTVTTTGGGDKPTHYLGADGKQPSAKWKNGVLTKRGESVQVGIARKWSSELGKGKTIHNRPSQIKSGKGGEPSPKKTVRGSVKGLKKSVGVWWPERTSNSCRLTCNTPRRPLISLAKNVIRSL